MGTLGVQEMVVIFLVALVLFGPKKLPELGRTIGKALTEFRRASSDLKATFEREMQTLERENDSLKTMTQQTANEIYNHVENYVYQPADSYGSESLSQNEHAALPSGTPETTNPSTVSASAVPGAESNGTTSTAVAELPAPAPEAAAEKPSEEARELPAPRQAVEGTVARSEVNEASQHS